MFAAITRRSAVGAVDDPTTCLLPRPRLGLAALAALTAGASRQREEDLDRERTGVAIPVYEPGRILPVAYRLLRCPPREHFPPGRPT